MANAQSMGAVFLQNIKIIITHISLPNGVGMNVVPHILQNWCPRVCMCLFVCVCVRPCALHLPLVATLQRHHKFTLDFWAACDAKGKTHSKKDPIVSQNIIIMCS